MKFEKYGMKLDDECVFNMREARKAYLAGDKNMALFWYRKNRAEHGLETYFECEYPDPIRFVHPIGCVLGRATYAPHLVCYQGSGVGSDLDGNRPTFTGPCCLFPGSRILGGVTVGKNVLLTANVVVHGNVTIPDNCIVVPAVGVAHDNDDLSEFHTAWVGWEAKPTKRSVAEEFFNV